jgi:hypothetical protein
MAVGVVDLLEVIQVHHKQRQRLGLQRIPVHFVSEIVQKKTAVVYTRKLIFEDQPRGVRAHMLEKIKEILVFHTRCPGQIRELYGY